MESTLSEKNCGSPRPRRMTVIRLTATERNIVDDSNWSQLNKAEACQFEIASRPCVRILEYLHAIF
eukprot:497248-Amorphochlora_amoeboformis.AAC.1